MSEHFRFSEKDERQVYKPKSSAKNQKHGSARGAKIVYKKSAHIPPEREAHSEEALQADKPLDKQTPVLRDDAAADAAAEIKTRKKPKKATRLKKSEKPKKAQDSEKAQKSEEIEKAENLNKTEITENTEKHENLQKAEKAQDTEKAEETEKNEKPTNSAGEKLPFFFPLTLATVAAVLIWSFLFNGKTVAWTLFLVIPIIYSAQNAVKKRDADEFSFFALTLFVYCFVGIRFNAWHPWWLIFACVPIYHICVTLIKKISARRKSPPDKVKEQAE